MEDKERSMDLAKNLLGSIGFFLVSVFVIAYCIQMPVPGGRFLVGPSIFPLLCGVLLLICAVVYFVQTMKSGARFKDIGPLLTLMVKSKSSQMVLLAIGIIFLYILVGVNYISFYLSTFVFIFAICTIFVKRWKIWQTLLMDLGVLAFLYVVFYMIFNVRLL